MATADDAERDEQAREIARRLRNLVDIVPAILELNAGQDIIGDGNWHVALVADFADRDALEEYIEHPQHQEVVAFIRSVVSDRVAVDFEV